MILERYYLSEPHSLQKAKGLIGLSQDEIEHIVGRFKADHWRFPGKLKGELLLKSSGQIIIRHHFTKKVLWKDFVDFRL